MKLVWTKSAAQQLRAEAAYIAGSRPETARKWILGLRIGVDRLRQFPYSGRTVLEYPNSTKRELIHGQYRVIYDVRSDGVFVLTLRHSRQMLPGESSVDIAEEETGDGS